MAAPMFPRTFCGARQISLQSSTFRCLSVSTARNGKWIPPPREEAPDIPGLEPITYADRMYYVPDLARPRFQDWDKGWADPRYYRAPAPEKMRLFREKPSYVFHRGCRLLGGVKQALWLTKTKLIEGLPQAIIDICDDPAYQFPNHEELAHNLISQACLWHRTGEQPLREEYCPKLLQGFLHLCRTQTSKFPALSQRSLVENCRLATSWRRESNIYHVRGINGFLLTSKSPLTPLASSCEIQATEHHKLESLYPISPAIDLQEVNVYEEQNDAGFRPGFQFPHPHTVFLMDPCSTKARFLPDQLRAKMIMLAFGSAVAKAKMLYGEDAKVLQEPILVQSISTDGQLFHFLVFQLNTLDLTSEDGVKNLVWMEPDQPLYTSASLVPKIKRKVVEVPAGVCGFQSQTFMKFWAMYLQGAV
ncbi:hypothetical protein GDO86_007808 [Hymenochirus boettgeri]|uniref:Large ribosomal subunit protein mL37 n=1 Tax=Hymenochirus boettgeri TaxID=247094 RepID=A0A8T2J0L6_9PIPI|nr:hypothetical protein GDO86_007808 [Hymenochirus boettgeri]